MREWISRRQFGAAAILCPSVRSQLEEQLGSPFLVLPSSVHEVLCLSSAHDSENTGWSGMVHEINDMCVEPIDRLSDHAYLCMEGVLMPLA